MSSITLAVAQNELGIKDDVNADNSYTMAGQNPKEILTHSTEKDYNILGITPDEFIKKHGSPPFDFDELKRKFRMVCEDYEDDLTLETKSKAVEFCSRLIYEVGPESRKVTKQSGDKVWKFRFMYNKKDKLIIKTAFVCTFKGERSEYKETTELTKIILTVKHAMLLSILTFERINAIAINMIPPMHLLTPLAGAVFSKEDVEKLSRGLKCSTLTTLNVINSSCQSSGHYLPSAKLHCAVIGVIVATKNITDKKVKDGIITKTIRQYLAQKKTWEFTKFVSYASYAHGGIPNNLIPENLIKEFELIQESQITARSAKKAAIETHVTSQVITPHLTPCIILFQ